MIKKHTMSVKYALEGIAWAFRMHPNYKIHAFISAFVLLLGWYLGVTYIEWIILILTITLGFVIETVNTAIEATTDAIDKEWREDIKIAKDASAAAMLLYSVGAAVVGLIIFVPKFLT